MSWSWSWSCCYSSCRSWSWSGCSPCWTYSRNSIWSSCSWSWSSCSQRWGGGWVEQETEYVEVDGCVIIPDESANSAPRPPPVVFDPLLDALHTLQLRMDEVIEGHSDAWAGRQKRRCRQWFELVHPDHGGSDKGFVAVKAANEVAQQNLNAWREVYLLWDLPAALQGPARMLQMPWRRRQTAQWRAWKGHQLLHETGGQ